MVVREYYGKEEESEEKAKKEEERTGGVPKWSEDGGAVPIRDFKKKECARERAKLLIG
jgi:hypothetical protein